MRDDTSNGHVLVAKPSQEFDLAETHAEFAIMSEPGAQQLAVDLTSKLTNMQVERVSSGSWRSAMAIGLFIGVAAMFALFVLGE